MKRNVAILLTSVLALGAASMAQADTAATPAPATVISKEKANIRKEDQAIKKDNADIKNTEKQRATEGTKLEKDEKAGNSAAVAADKQAIKKDSTEINKDLQKNNVADRDVNKDKKVIKKEIVKDKKASTATPAASTAPAKTPPTH